MPDKSHTDLAHAFVAVAATNLGATVSRLTEVEAWLRVTSLCVGITVACISGWCIWRRRDK